MRDGQGKEWKKKEIHQLWNLTGIGIEQRGLFTKHPMVRSEGKKVSLGRYGWSPLRRLAYCFVTRAGSIESCPSAHAPTTTSAAIQPPMDGNGASLLLFLLLWLVPKETLATPSRLAFMNQSVSPMNELYMSFPIEAPMPDDPGRPFGRSSYTG